VPQSEQNGRFVQHGAQTTKPLPAEADRGIAAIGGLAGMALKQEDEMSETIEVVCEDKMCFKVDAVTLEPVGKSYYEPAALSDPRGRQMSHSEWSRSVMDRREAALRKLSELTREIGQEL
jgi:hypothetical protein